MTYLLAFVLLGLMAMVVVSLLRGLNAFRQSMDAEKDGGAESGTGATELQLMQNKMMWARIKYQALAVVGVGVLLAFAR